MAVELGVGYVSIVPSSRDFAKKLSAQLANVAARVAVLPDTSGFSPKLNSALGHLTGRVPVTPDVKNFSSSLHSQVGNQSSLGRSMGDSAGEGFASSLTSAARRALGAVAAVFAAQKLFDVGKAAFGVAADFEQTEVAFVGLLGSAEKAAGLLAELQQFAAVTPFEFPELADAGKKLLAFGFDASEIIPTMGKLGDAASALGASGSDINLVVRALGQIGSKGRVQLEELNQIAESFPGTNPVAVLADAIGVSTADFTKALSQPGGALTEFGLTGKEAVRILVDGLQEVPGAMGAMERQSRTLKGTLSTLRDTLRITAIESLKPFLPGIADFILKTVIPAVERLGRAVPPIIRHVVDSISEVVEAFRSGFSGQLSDADGFAGVVERIGEAAAVLRRQIPPLVEGFGSLVDGFKAGASGIDQAGLEGKLAAVGEKVGGLVRVVKDNPDVFGPIAAGLAGLAGAMLLASQAASGLTLIGSAFGGLASLLPLLLNPLGLVVGAVTALGVAAFIAYKKFTPFRAAVDSVAQTFKAAGFAAAVDEAGVQFGRLWDIVQPKLIEFRDKAFAFLKENGPEIFRGLGAALGGILAFLGTELLVPLGNWISQTAAPWLRDKIVNEWGPAFFDWVIATVPKLLDQLARFIDAIIKWGQENEPKILSTINKLADLFFGWIEKTVIPKLQEELPKITAVLFSWAIENLPKWGAQLAVLGADAIGRLAVTIIEHLPDLFLTIPGQLALLGLAMIGAMFKSIFDQLPEGFQNFTKSIIDFVTGLPGQIASAAVGMWDGIGEAFKGAINFIIRTWNSLPSFEIPGFDPPGPGSFGGFTFGLPKIDELAGGGVFGSDFTGLLRLAETPAARPEIVTPQRLMAETFRKVLVEVGGGHGRPLIEGGLYVTEAASANATVDAINAKLGWMLTTRNER